MDQEQQVASEHRVRLGVMIGVLAVLVACTEPNPLFDDSAGPCESGEVVIEPFDVANPWRVDILMVVDNSPGMAGTQEALAEGMPAFVAALNAIEALDYQLGVVSTDIVDATQQGQLQTGLSGQAGCPGDRPRIISRSTSSGPTVAACNVVLGETGDDFEAGLEALRYALLGPAAQSGVNRDFLRPDSRLVTIIVSDEDDCSDSGSLSRSDPRECEWSRGDLIPLDTYLAEGNFFDLIRPNRGSPVNFVALTGPDDGTRYSNGETPEPVCTGRAAVYHGPRYHEVAEALGSRGGAYNLCARSLESTLLDVVASHVAPQPETLCATLSLTQPPVQIEVTGGDSTITLAQGVDGFVYLGSTEACPTGAFEVSPTRQGTLGDGEVLNVHYCTDDPIPQ